MFRINPRSEDYPDAIEALKAHNEVEILGYQTIGLFMSKPVRHVLSQLECRYGTEWRFALDVFNYGFIMGKRAERARRAKSKQADT